MKTFIRFTLLASAMAIGLFGLHNVSDAGKPAPPPAFPPMPIHYKVTWLRAPNGTANTQATSLNDSGTVAGYYDDANGQTRACIWTAAGVFDLNGLVSVPDGWVLIGARAINNSGQIAGSAKHQVTGLVRVYRYDPATVSAPAQVTLMGDLTSSVNHQIVYVRPLNNLGDVGYYMSTGAGTGTSYVQTMAGNVFELSGYGFNSISDSRQLVGGNIRWTVSTGQVEVFSSKLSAFDVNVDGYFVGRSLSGTSKAMRYQSSAQIIGPASSYALGINASSDVVGNVDTGVGFIFTDTYGYVDLDTRVTGSNADLTLWYSSTSIQPMKITDHAVGNFGEICGTAYFTGNINRAFVLTPIPAP